MAWGSDDICAVRAAIGGGIANTQRVCFQYRVNRYTISKTGANEVKFEATIGEREWYDKLLNEYVNNVDKLDETDKRYLYCLKNDKPRIFKNKFKLELLQDLSNNPLRLFLWLRRKKELEMTAGRIIYYWIVAIKNRQK